MAAVRATVILASVFSAFHVAAGQCARAGNPFVGGALTLENLLLFDGGLRFTNASGMVHIKDIPADTDATSATRCRSTFSRRQKSGIKSLVRNIS